MTGVLYTHASNLRCLKMAYQPWKCSTSVALSIWVPQVRWMVQGQSASWIWPCAPGLDPRAPYSLYLAPHTRIKVLHCSHQVPHRIGALGPSLPPHSPTYWDQGSRVPHPRIGALKPTLHPPGPHMPGSNHSLPCLPDIGSWPAGLPTYTWRALQARISTTEGYIWPGN